MLSVRMYNFASVSVLFSAADFFSPTYAIIISTCIINHQLSIQVLIIFCTKFPVSVSFFVLQIFLYILADKKKKKNFFAWIDVYLKQNFGEYEIRIIW